MSRLANATSVAAPLSRIETQLLRIIRAVLRIPQRSGRTVAIDSEIAEFTPTGNADRLGFVEPFFIVGSIAPNLSKDHSSDAIATCAIESAARSSTSANDVTWQSFCRSSLAPGKPLQYAIKRERMAVSV